MAIVDQIKHESPSDEFFAWKHDSETIKFGSQLVVGEGQAAIFVKGGEALDVFGPGTHTLKTGNIPLIEKIINIPFGGDTPFTAEVWFVSTTVKRDLKWGTAKPIALFDKSIGFPVSLRAYGKWGVRIEEMLIVHSDHTEIVSNFPVEQITVVDPIPGYAAPDSRDRKLV